MSRRVAGTPISHLAVCLALLCSCAQAYAPTPREECERRNHALCELNNLPFEQAAPCPPGSRTLRPPSKENCDAIRPQPVSPAGQPVSSSPPSTPAVPNDFARYAAVEHWLIPTVVIGGSALAALGIVWLLYRRRGSPRPDPASSRGFWSILTVSQFVGLVCALAASKASFQTITASYHDNNTAAPTLIGAAVAMAVFFVIQPVAALLSGVLIRRLWLSGNR